MLEMCLSSEVGGGRQVGGGGRTRRTRERGEGREVASVRRGRDEVGQGKRGPDEKKYI